MRKAPCALLIVVALISIGSSVSAVYAQDSRLGLKPAAVSGAGASPPTITFAFARDGVGVPVPKYKLVIHDDGSGSYEGEALPPPTRYGRASSAAAVPFQRDIRLARENTVRLFQLAAQLDHFNRACASKAKNIADTGTKTLTYSGPDGSGSCTYNYTEIRELTALTDLILGITETLDEGRELDRLHRYDRLGLDQAVTYLQQEVAAGRAQDLETIAASLRSIADDDDVLARVRAKASAMLTQIAAAERDTAP